MKNPAPYRYDIVGSFLRTKAIHEARSRFEAGEISAEELARVEDAEITGLEIPTGQPIVYELDDNLQALERYYLSER